MVDRLGINILYTAPTAIRALMREGDEWVKVHERTSLRVLGTVGEPINPEAWRWYHGVVGDGHCSIVDTYWQTETGGHILTGLAGANDMKPGSASLPFFGIEPVLVDPDGNELEGNQQSGLLCMARSWPGMMRTVYGDHERFINTYFIQYPGKYFTGDGSFRDHDGYYWLTGRVDDVLNVRATGWARPRSRARWSVTRAAPRPRSSATRTRSRARGSTPTCCSRTASIRGRISRAS